MCLRRAVITDRRVVRRWSCVRVELLHPHFNFAVRAQRHQRAHSNRPGRNVGQADVSREGAYDDLAFHQRELPADARTEANKVRGCASQVWMKTDTRPNGADGPVLEFHGDSDAHIVRGLIAILFALYSGKPARSILATDAQALFEKLGLREHLTPQRSNGFRAMVDRIQSDAHAALSG